LSVPGGDPSQPSGVTSLPGGDSSAPGGDSSLRDASPDELEDWDARTVDAPGGHVYQSRAWAEHRRASGWEPRFLVADDGGRALALTRRWPLIGGGSAYVPRGPVPMGADAATLGARLVAIGAALAGEGIDVVAADPEVPDADRAFRARIEGSGFRPIEEIQPSRHRISLAIEGRSEDDVFAGISKSTRQRIKKAEDTVEFVSRHDGRVPAGGLGEGFSDSGEAAEVALDRFYDLLLLTGERLHFTFGPRGAFVSWWRAALGAGHLVFLEAWGIRGVPVAGLILYRHGDRLSTVHSGDHPEDRDETPGAMHLLRWRAIQLAIREGRSEMDLGGVDVAGARGEPREGDPLYGLHQHKTSFGGRWLELTGAHERVYDPRGYRAGRLTSRIARLVGR
jgi:lipid II:glycine glycyltransferase (peptidoglycan interpeptide bridge formation enzyme)